MNILSVHLHFTQGHCVDADVTDTNEYVSTTFNERLDWVKEISLLNFPEKHAQVLVYIGIRPERHATIVTISINIEVILKL